MYKTLEDVERVISMSKSQNVIDMFIDSYLQGVEYEAWLENAKAEHETLYPKDIDGEPILDTDGITVLYYEQIPNPDYVPFNTWMKETEQVQIGTKDILDADGITVVGTEPVYEDRLIRQYTEVPVDIETWKTESNIYAEGTKQNALEELTVTTTSGKVFYADPDSRNDMTQAVLLGQMESVTSTDWKLAEPIPGVAPKAGTEKVYTVTLAELAEAVHLALENKGQIVGAI